VKINYRKQNEFIIFDIEGDFRKTEVMDVTLHQLVKDQLDSGNKKFLLNFEKVGSIDSCCVGEIVSSYISINNMGGKLLRANTPKKIEVIFKVTGLERIIPNHEGVEQAIRSLQNTKQDKHI